MTDVTKPGVKPARPYFSSGPCAKPPGWEASKLGIESLGRSHRAKIGKARLGLAIDLMREVLQVPDTHRIGIVPGSDTGAFEMAMWTMLGAKPVTTLAWESFGEGWVTDAAKQLKLDPTILRADYGSVPDLSQVDWSNDVLFTWNGTTSGARVPNGDWIAADRDGLSFCDATSAVFAYDMPWDRLDVTTFSWQKVLGGEGGHGVIILGPRAVERLENYTPAWPLPKVFRLVSKGKLAEGVFKGETINTPSMLAVEDVIFALEWAKSVGGLSGLIARSNANAAALGRSLRSAAGLVTSPPIRRPGPPPPFASRSTARTKPSSRRWPVRWRRKARPTTSRAIATPRQASASGVARRWKPPTSRRSAPGSTGPTRPPRQRFPHNFPVLLRRQEPSFRALRLTPWVPACAGTQG
jgi:phosphoserine aminotransferase